MSERLPIADSTPGHPADMPETARQNPSIFKIKMAILAAIMSTIAVGTTAFLVAKATRERDTESIAGAKKTEMTEKELNDSIEKATEGRIKIGRKEGQNKNDTRERFIFILDGEQHSYVVYPPFRKYLGELKDPKKIEEAIYAGYREIKAKNEGRYEEYKKTKTPSDKKTPADHKEADEAPEDLYDMMGNIFWPY